MGVRYANTRGEYFLIDKCLFMGVPFYALVGCLGSFFIEADFVAAAGFGHVEGLV